MKKENFSLFDYESVDWGPDESPLAPEDVSIDFGNPHIGNPQRQN